MKQAALALLLVLAGCGDSPTGPQYPDFEGTYTYAGTINGQPNLSAAGTLSLQNQEGSTVTFSQTITIRVDGVPFFTFLTQVPGQATVDEDGRITWDQEGVATGADGFNYGYQIEHDGELSGNRITGTWTIQFSDGSVDAGSFTASR
jgi:hypothetical protein